MAPDISETSYMLPRCVWGGEAPSQYFRVLPSGGAGFIFVVLPRPAPYRTGDLETKSAKTRRVSKLG